MHREISLKWWWENKGEPCLTVYSWKILYLRKVCSLAAALRPVTSRCTLSPWWYFPKAPLCTKVSLKVQFHIQWPTMAGSWLPFGQPSKVWPSSLLEILLSCVTMLDGKVPLHTGTEMWRNRLKMCSYFFYLKLKTFTIWTSGKNRGYKELNTMIMLSKGCEMFTQ